MRRAARAAFGWPEEAAALVEAGRSLQELRSVGPFLEKRIRAWLEERPEAPQPPPIRRGFLTTARARAVLAADPRLAVGLQGDLQCHTTWSDGREDLETMTDAARAKGYRYVAVTDHSKGLAIANGMDEARLALQRDAISARNAALARDGFRVLSSLEMNLTPEGAGDMDPSALAPLDLVLGAFHSALRRTEDQTERYLAAIENPTFHVLAHPRGRIFNRRLGLVADWDRVFAAAAEAGKAVEIDAYLDRQDLDVALLERAGRAGCRISIGTDAHSVSDLDAMPIALASATLAGIPRERILNFLPLDELLAWARGERAG